MPRNSHSSFITPLPKLPFVFSTTNHLNIRDVGFDLQSLNKLQHEYCGKCRPKITQNHSLTHYSLYGFKNLYFNSYNASGVSKSLVPKSELISLPPLTL
jgi:hypothetical protein